MEMLGEHQIPANRAQAWKVLNGPIIIQAPI